jgi:hypothetical protein
MRAKYGYAYCPVCHHPNVHVEPSGKGDLLMEHYSGHMRCKGSTGLAEQATTKPRNLEERCADLGLDPFKIGLLRRRA